jgi:hypothetical protein
MDFLEPTLHHTDSHCKYINTVHSVVLAPVVVHLSELYCDYMLEDDLGKRKMSVI